MFNQWFLDCLMKVSVVLCGMTLIDLAWRNASADIKHRLWRWTCVIALTLPLGSLLQPQFRLPIALGNLIVIGSRTSSPTALEARNLSDVSGGFLDSKTINGRVSNSVDVGIRDGGSSRASESDSNVPNLLKGLTEEESPITPDPRATIPPVKWTSLWFTEENLYRCVFMIWLSGVVLTLRPLMSGRRYIRRMLSNAEEISDFEILLELQRTGEKLGSRSRVRLLHSSGVSTPMTFGVFWPLILLPSNWRTWTPGAWQAALLHEFAHVQRRDVAWQLLARVTCAIYWFHPLVWYAAMRLKIVRELACDDAVVTAGQSATGYASHLVAIAKACIEQTPEPGLDMAQVTGLEQRIRALMDDSRSHAPVSRSLSVFLLLMALVVGGPLMIVQASIMPVHDFNLSEGTNADSQDAAKDDSTLEIAGTVVGPNGQLIEGAKLYVLHMGLRSSYITEISKPAGISKSDGRFSFRINPKEYDGNDGGWAQSHLVATKEGYGLAADGIFLFESTGRGVEAADGIMRSYRSARMIRNKRTMSLTDDSASIEGRVLDNTNQPLAGARVSVLDLIGGSVAAFDRWEAEAGMNSQAWILIDSEIRKSLFLNYGRAFDSFLLPIVTDAEGRFAIRGLGRNRVARLSIRHPQCEFQEIQVRTRDGEILKTPKHVLNERLETVGFEMEPCYPRQFEIAIPPSVPLVGTVKDARTGMPIPGALVSTGLDQVHLMFAFGSRAVTDENGSYELHGFVSRAVKNPLIPGLDVVTITPPVGLPYFPLRVRPHVDLEKTRHELDIALKSGVFIRGQVRKESTDDAVMGTVYGAPTNDNSNAEELLKLGATLKTHARTDSEGNFALLATPGKFHVGFRAKNSNEFILEGGHLGQKEPTLPAFVMNYVAEMVVGETGLDDRKIQLLPQRTIEIEVLDRSGKPVSEGNNGILSYRNPGTFSGSSFHANISPFIRSEVVILYDYMTGDAAKITVTADDTRVKLQLSQAATIRGRLVAADGTPKVGCVAHGKEVMRRCRHADVVGGDFFWPPITDFEGRFEMVGIVGQNYEFCLFSQNTDLRSETIRVEVKSPDLIDLGDITMPTK